ncbi:MAG: hypothetical protein NVS3B11_10370 [Collimonas sp.]
MCLAVHSNPECKLILATAVPAIFKGLDQLDHALHARLLLRRRCATLRIGAKQEGIVRHERIMRDGRKRNSVRFRIIDSEWPEVKAMLQQKIAR